MSKRKLTEIDVQVRLCLNCSKPFVVLAGSTKVFCSPRCRRIFHDRLKRKRRRERNPAWARAELQRLLQWKQEHKNKPARSVDPAGTTNERSDVR